MNTIPTPVVTRDDIYNQLQRSVWNRGPDSGPESGHTWIYRPFGAIARRTDSAHRHMLEAIRDEFLVLYGITNTPSVMPDEHASTEECMEIVHTLFNGMPSADTLVCEGYGMDSATEGARLDYRLVRAALRHDGSGKNRAIYAGGTVCDTWNNKAHFRAAAMEIHGPSAVTMGTELPSPELGATKAWLGEIFDVGYEKAVIKINGGGGMGNLIVNRDHVNDNAIATMISRAQGSWMIGEAWRPWVRSFCVSFFAPDALTLPVHMTVCDQVLTKAGAFIGGKSFDTLSLRDQEALGTITRPLALRMRDDGMRGFMGFDVILCVPQRGDRNILPDCGLAVVFIETNARVNGHNQEILALDLLARRDGIRRDDLVHMRVRNKAVTSAADRAASWRFFTERLNGIAKPLTSRKLVEGEAYFLLDVNNGGMPSPHDAVMLVGTEEAAPRIKAAFESLQSEGLLMT